MAKIISTPKISEILLEEFMNPLQISAYRLAMDIHVPTSRILEILHDRRKITADTSIRLGRYFGVSDSYFLNLQSDIDMRSDAARAERGSGWRVAQPTRLQVLKPQANESTE